MIKSLKRFTVSAALLIILFSACLPLVLAVTERASYAAPSGGGLPEHDERTLIEAAQAMRRAGMVQFNFTELDLLMFVRFASELMQRTIIVPPNAAGRITIISPKPSTITEARQIFISTLQSQGWTLQNMGEYDKLVQGISPHPSWVSTGVGGPGQGEEIVTHLVSLRYIVADLVIQAMQQSFGQNLIVLPVGNGRDIILQGRATDVSRGLAVIRNLDLESSARISRVFQLQYADPALIANQLNAIAQQGGQLRGLSAVPDPSSRQVVLLGEARVIADAAAVIAQLDIYARDSEFHIYKLNHIDATAAAEQLGKLLAATTTQGQDGRPPATVVPDVTTNSLIFSATQRQFDSMKKILESIDVQAKQVLIRGFIAEVNITKLDNSGVDWNFLGGHIWDNFMLGGMGQLGEAPFPLDFFQQYINREVIRDYDIHGRPIYERETRPLALLYATIEMLKKYDAINVLSVPRLMCTDGKESSFLVGQVIPVLTGQASDITNLGATQQSINYRDTGLTLTVTPHVRSGNVVVLEIEQTTEDVLTAASSVTPVTAKRQVKTTVTVEDGETIILGGMIKETERSLRRRVPGISYIPLIGNLFQKVTKDREKVDFIIFLTPTIITNTEQTRNVTGQSAMAIGSPDLLRLEMSPTEREIDERFRMLYERSVRSR